MNWENAGIIIFHTRVEYQEKWKAPDNPFVEFLRYSLYTN